MPVWRARGLEPDRLPAGLKSHQTELRTGVELAKPSRQLQSARADLLLNPAEKFAQPAAASEMTSGLSSRVAVQLRQRLPDRGCFGRRAAALGRCPWRPIRSRRGFVVVSHRLHNHAPPVETWGKQADSFHTPGAQNFGSELFRQA